MENESAEKEEEQPHTHRNDAMTQTLEIPELLQSIIESLLEDPATLKMCRQVSRTWKLVSDSVSLRQGGGGGIWKVKLDLDHHLVGNNFNENNENYNSLIKSKLPSSTFELNGPLPCPPPLSLSKIFGLRLQGPSIKSLILHMVQFQSFSTLQKILTSLSSNLTSLRITNTSSVTPFLQNFEQNDTNLFVLPALQTFEWDDKIPPLLVRQILRAAPNLRTIPFLTIHHLDVVTDTGQVDKVRSLQCLKFWRSWQPSLLTAFATQRDSGGEAQLRIQQLEIGVSRGSADFESVEEKFEYAHAFQQLLESSKGTLERLSLNSFGTFFSVNFKFPQLPKLRVLSLTVSMFYSMEFPRLFPPDINLAASFPNLAVLDCTKLSMNYDFNWAKYFPPPNPFQGHLDSVKRLVINDKCNKFWMDRLWALCPNFDGLTLHLFSDGLTADLAIDGDDENVTTLLPNVFKKWRHLRSLVLHFRNENIDSFQLDPLLTGVDRETCDRIRKMVAGDYEGDLKKYKIYPGIIDLHQLKRLRIRFHRQSNVPLSTLACHGGFQLMPDLKVRLEFDHRAPHLGNRSEFETTVKALATNGVNIVHRL